LSQTGRPRVDLYPRKILLLRLRRLGDVILTTPAITLLKRAFPGASLTYLVEEPFRRLVEGNPHLDRVLAIPAKQRASELIALIRSIRREGYDILLDFHGGPRASWITLLGGAKLKVGYAIKGKGFLYDIRVPRSGERGPVHSVENHANLVRAIGVNFALEEIPPLLLPEPTAAEKDHIRVLLAEAFRPSHSSAEISRGPSARESDPQARLGALTRDDITRLSAAESDPQAKPGAPAAAPASPLVVLHVGAGNRFRDWGAENLFALASRFVRDAKARVALIGAAGDRAVEQSVRAAAPESILPFAGRLNLMETRELIRRASLFAGPDSGPMHIAASTPTPIVAWFGPTLPANFAPWRPDGGRTVILERALACRPCEQRACATSDFRCLQTISPDDVFESCRPFLL